MEARQRRTCDYVAEAPSIEPKQHLENKEGKINDRTVATFSREGTCLSTFSCKEREEDRGGTRAM